MKLPEKVVNAAALFAIVVGATKVIGDFCDIPILTSIGQTFAMSPAPKPYTRVFKTIPDSVQSGSLFGCEDLSGQVTWHRWNYLVRGAVPGPHRRIVTYIGYFNSFRHYKDLESDDLNEYDLAEKERIDEWTRYYFCGGGPLAKAAGCPNPLAAVLLKAPSPPSLTRFDSRRVPCAK